MLVTFIHFELGQEHPAKAILGNHAFDSVRDQPFRGFCPHLLDGRKLLATLPSGIGHELLGSLFLARDTHLLGVNHDHKVTSIKVRSINWLVLPA